MNKKRAVILSVCGTVAVVMAGILIFIGILDGIERSQYQNLTINIPLVLLLGMLFIAGAVMLSIGIRGIKSGKHDPKGGNKNPNDTKEAM